MSVGDFLGSVASGASSWIGGAVEAIATPFTEWQKRKTEIKQAQHELEMADLAFRSQLVMNRESHNQVWEIEALKRPPQKSPMQWISFIVLGCPFIIAWFNPQLVNDYFNVSLVVIPLWYQQTFISIIGVIWGIANLKNAAEGINKMLLQRKEVDITRLMDIASDAVIRPEAMKPLKAKQKGLVETEAVIEPVPKVSNEPADTDSFPVNYSALTNHR